MSEAERVRVAIIGSGFGGLAMAIKLREAGIHDLVMLERADSIGGTWRDNHYPGCACDVPAHLYSYSFAPNPNWSEAFSPQPEIRAYIERTAAQHELHRLVRFGAEIVSCVLDETTATWTIRARDGRVFIADFVVSAAGGLARPLVPALPGLDTFKGPTWHSAQWNHDVDLTGKTVAVVGTGASAIQFVPQIAPKVARLHLFQRTPPWVLPRADHSFTAVEKQILRIPPIRWLYRQSLYWRHELRAVPFTLAPGVLKLAQRLAIRHLHQHIRDPELRRKLTPDYVMGCKRVLMSNTYYPALARPNVEVVTDGIREVTATGVVTTDGALRSADAIVFGTGFDVHDYLGPIQIIGRNGVDLAARWRKNPEAYLGTTVPGFPNFFTVVGPNTGLGHNSIIVVIEAQVRYAMSCLQAARRQGAVLIEPRDDVADRYNQRVQERLARTVWSSGCKSWYQNAEGKNTTLWPGSTVEFAMRTMRCNPADYIMKRRDELPAQEPVPRLRALAEAIS